MIFTSDDLESRKIFIKSVKRTLDSLIKYQAKYLEQLKDTENEIQSMRDILSALEAAEILQKELKK